MSHSHHCLIHKLFLFFFNILFDNNYNLMLFFYLDNIMNYSTNLPLYKVNLLFFILVYLLELHSNL